MKTVKLNMDCLIGTRNHASGEIVIVPDDRAADLVKAKVADYSDGTPVNDDHNPMADFIEPIPPGGPVIHPMAAATPVIRDNPGLSAQTDAVGIPDGEKDTDIETRAVEGQEGSLEASETATVKPGRRNAARLTGRAE